MSSKQERLMARLQDVYEAEKKQSDERNMKDLEAKHQAVRARVPSEVLDKIPMDQWSELHTIVFFSLEEHGFVASYAMQFLKRYQHDAVVIDWLCSLYGFN